MTLADPGKRPLLRELSTGLTRPMRRGLPVASSACKAWDGFLVEEHSSAESHSQNVCLLQPVVLLSLAGEASLECWAGGRHVRKTIRPGQVSILPANDPYSVRLSAAGGSVMVSLESRLLTCAAAEQGYLGPIATAWAHGADDPLLREAVLALRNEMGKLDGSAGYARNLAGTLAAHLVRNYSTHRPELAETRAGLSPVALRRVVRHIEDHLAENVSIDDLAGVAGLSACHFARMFKQSTGMTPHQHVLNSRVAKAKGLLLDTSATLAEVASLSGFYDQAHLTRCFRRFVGTTPANFARHVSRPESSA
jgi:AraC family transcriptional regulator